MTGDPSKEKRALRAELRERRRNLTATEREAATDAFTQHLIELTTKSGAQAVSAYLPNADEPNIRAYLDWALEQGHRVLLPISRDDGLLDWVVADGESEEDGPFGWPEPVGELLGPIAINDVDLIIVPAAAVDRSGMRMGWGRGYIDRTLGSMEKCPPVYAVIFDNEFLEAVPTELHDKPVNGVVTPSGVVTF
jgi:5-formyltetrahydrofolate cyclo-ligase